MIEEGYQLVISNIEASYLDHGAGKKCEISENMNKLTFYFKL